MRGIAAALLAVCALMQGHQPTEYVLDLLTYRHTDQAAGSASWNEPASRVVGGIVDGPAVPKQVAVSLEQLDRGVYAPGDVAIAEIAIKNIGNVPVSIPWSPDRLAVPSEDVVEAIVALEVRDVTGRRLLSRLQPQALFGSRGVAGTLQTLAPGDRALIRMPAKWNAPEAQRDLVLREPRGMVKLFAIYQHDRQEDRSADGITVTFISNSKE